MASITHQHPHALAMLSGQLQAFDVLRLQRCRPTQHCGTSAGTQALLHSPQAITQLGGANQQHLFEPYAMACQGRRIGQPRRRHPRQPAILLAQLCQGGGQQGQFTLAVLRQQ